MYKQFKQKIKFGIRTAYMYLTINFGEDKYRMKDMNITKTLKMATFAAVLATPMVANAVPVDLTGWTAEGGSSSWNVQPGNDTVLQTVNGNPTVFFDSTATTSQGTALSGKIRVTSGGNGDDDFIGFVLGYDTGGLNTPTGASTAGSDFLLIDWKQGDQNFSGFAPKGLAISHIAGAGVAGDFWDHSGSVTQLARGTSLGSTGWLDDTEYSFDILFTSNLIQVSVDGALELSVTSGDAGLASFGDGSFGFYNYSQEDVLYSSITQVDCNQTPNAPGCQQGGGNVPEPTTIALMGLGLAGLGFRRGKKQA